MGYNSKFEMVTMDVLGRELAKMSGRNGLKHEAREEFLPPEF